MSETILELKKISKSFSGVEVLHEVSLAWQPGEILLQGETVHFSDARESRQAGIAAIYQELRLFPDLDVAENIFAGRQPVTFGGW